MLRQLAVAAGRGLSQQQQALAAGAAAPCQALARLVSTTPSSAAAAGDRGDEIPAATKYGGKAEERTSSMGDKADARARQMGFDIPPGGANAAPDPDSAGRVGGANLGGMVDAVGGMLHGDRGRVERGVGNMAQEQDARTASNPQATTERWPKSRETTVDGPNRTEGSPHPASPRGDQGPLSTGYSSSSGGGDRDVPKPMHMPSDAPNTGPDMGSGRVPGMGDGATGQQYGKLSGFGGNSMEDNLSQSAGTQGEATNFDDGESAKGTTPSSPGGAQP